MKKGSTELCPCGSGDALDACCARWHRTLQAPTAEALMRSRYSAFVLQNEAYLLATWHPGTRPGSVGFEAGTKWLGLTVKSACVTGPDRAEVEFVARYRVGGGSAVRIHERSRFVHEDGRWLYVDGDQIS
ncbi:MAG: YchJ family metal-binding protein [Nevskia sp.]|nr:YchJ family metal-binding protein [Nevskia sp.]